MSESDVGRPFLEGRDLTASLTVKDLHASLAWYRDVMGFAVTRQFEHDGQLRAVRLDAGNVTILIGQDDGAKGLDRIKGEGFSLQITTDQDLDALAQHIQEQGTVLATAPVDAPWGARILRVQDPDGFRWTISSGNMS